MLTAARCVRLRTLHTERSTRMVAMGSSRRTAATCLVRSSTTMTMLRPCMRTREKEHGTALLVTLHPQLKV